MKFILAEKQEMTQKFSADGNAVAVTRVIAGPCVVTQVKKNDVDGYVAVQVGFGKKKNLSKPMKGHLKDLGDFQYLKEFRLDAKAIEGFNVGGTITAKTFEVGDKIKVAGLSKGKGFQGVVKRHGFHGSPATHGHKDQLRMPGSIGAGGVQHVFKGVRMGGQMGGGQITVTNLSVIDMDSEKNELFIKGAVPGARGNLLLISGEGDVILEQVQDIKEVVENTESAEVETKEEVVEEKSENTAEDKKEETSVEVTEEVVEAEKVEAVVDSKSEDKTSS
jgi:large subunit ribosomal protein L3